MSAGDYIAIIRPVPASIGDCELTHMDRVSIDPEQARIEHDHYADVLGSLGCTLIVLPALDHHPDSVFVEDDAIVLDELALVTRPGAPSRRGEVDSVAEAIEPFRSLVEIEAPGTIDGGDVILVERTLFIGCSSRTNEVALSQVSDTLEPLGYTIIPVPINGCLHLKTGATALDDSTILCNPDWVDPARFEGLRTMDIDPTEPFGANVARIGEQLVVDAAYPRTNEQLADAGYDFVEVNLAELAKAEGAVTCSSILFKSNP